MKDNLLKIQNLRAKSDEKEILKGVNLDIRNGEVQVLLGPNASGKSTLAQVISGNQKYRLTRGKIFFQGKEITKLSPEKRVKLGIALAWQMPPTLKGVKLSLLLERISKNKIKLVEAKEILDREINADLSGGEKKISELLQILSLNPKLVIFDEIDSGLDIKKTASFASIIKKELIRKGVAILIVTHSGTILNFLKPDITNVIIDGEIICREKDFKKVLKTIKRYGYEKCKKCPFLADRS